MFHHHNLLYPLTGLKWKEQPHTLHREYSPNVKAWKGLEGVLTEGQGKERAASSPFMFCTLDFYHSSANTTTYIPSRVSLDVRNR